ncbi:hypothetical protein EST38_g13963 [Candolleomyces aberdarensis]|uniref:Uncharacterized protein n=1 Tax=Candolleomyces aberdarensis TaxID=2316362 RepID=A0A4Q2CZP4_9AGAR|nr:hypothetical protein EST38_g13963 [Candolleomyces aberdarensis]
MSEKAPSKHYMTQEKLQKLASALDEVNWKFLDYLYHMSNHKMKGSHENWYAQVMAAFLQGQTTHTPIEIINLW